MKIDEASKIIVKILAEQISTHNSASIIVSGGESPKNILKILDKIGFQWEKVEIMLADERLVDINNKHSNEKKLKENFFKNCSLNAKYTSIRKLEIKDITYQVAILGFGLDGHFASIFPEHIDDENFFSLASSPKILKTTPFGKPCIERLTLNMSFFSKTKNIFLIINSIEKLKVLEDARNNKKLPLYHLLNLKIPNIIFVYDFD